MDGNGHKIKILRTKPRKPYDAEKNDTVVQKRDTLWKRQQRIREALDDSAAEMGTRHRDYKES